MGKRNSAFTLVELLIVITIIILLAVIAMMFLRGQIFKGNDARRKGDLNRIKIALEEYEKDKNCYPQTVACGIDKNQEIYPYLNNVPCDPITHDSYPYEVGPASVSCPRWFRLYSNLENAADQSLISGIGPNAAYNYIVTSDNAPPLSTGGGTTSTLYACQGGYLVPITWDPSICSQTFPSTGFESACGTPSNPQNDCYP